MLIILAPVTGGVQCSTGPTLKNQNGGGGGGVNWGWGVGGEYYK